jgi:hypothetical protein
MLSIQDGKPIGPWRLITPIEISEVNSMLEKSNSIFEGFIQRADKREAEELAAMPSESFYQA